MNHISACASKGRVHIKWCAAVCAAVLLAGCGAIPGNPQGYSGINKLDAQFDENGAPKRIVVIGGKEQEEVTFSATLPGGTKAEYTARGVKAFDGQKARADLEAAISEDAKEAMPGIVDSVMSVIKGLL